MITLYVNNKYAAHIAFCLYLLDIDFIVYTDTVITSSSLINDIELQSYYSNVITNLNRETKFYLPYPVIAYYQANILNIVAGTSPTEPDISLVGYNSIYAIENALYNSMKSIGTIPNSLEIYTVELLPHNTFISWTVNRFFNRIPGEPEIAFHNMNNVAHKINIVAWILIIRFCDEGTFFGLNQEIKDYIRVQKYVIPGIPNIAVILHGYSRNYVERCMTSHTKYLVNNPYFDIFIHTWSDIGHKYERQLLKIDSNDIITKYNPRGLKVDQIWDKLKPEFSLVGKLYPIFLKNDQDKADASQYVNAGLYSIRMAINLIELFENQNGFTYNGILKWNFDTDITYIDMFGLWEDIQQDIIWFRQGCKECDKESLIPHPIKRHPNHKNDLDSAWYYGNRFFMAKALKLYDDAFKIAEEFQPQNILNISNVPHKQQLDFIYVFNDMQINFDINTKIVCFHPHTLMKEYLQNFFCKTTKNIAGDIIKPAVFNNNL